MVARLKTVEVTETYKMPDLVGKVEKGMTLLDERVPGWDRKIDLKQLDLSDNDRCVVGQLAIKSMLNGPLGGYDEGIEKVLANYTKDTQDGVFEKYDKREESHGFVVTAATARQVREWLEKQPATHPWWPLLFGPANGTNFEPVEAMRQVLYDYLTSIWYQVIKERARSRRRLQESNRAAKKTVAKKTTARR